MYQLKDNPQEYDNILEKRLIIVRLTACFICLALVNISGYYTNMSQYNLLILTYLTYNLGIWFYASDRKNSRLFLLSVYVDITVITSLIALRGGIRSDLYSVYFIVLSYILSKRQSYLIISSTLLIIVSYPIACLLFSDMGSYTASTIFARLAIRISIMLMAVFILFNVKTKMNHSSLLSQKAYEMALIDPLTKVYNRNMLETLCEYRRSHPYSISLAMIDIDDFKSINDSHGHLKGDTILSILGQLIKSNIRADDICIRYGGEEFLLAFKHTDNETALRILDRIKSAFGEHIIYCDDKQINCTISAGLAFGGEDMDTENIISLADKALYQAKRNGKNNIMTYCSAS